MDLNMYFDHYNFNVFNLEKSLEFYDKALSLKEYRRRTADDGSFILVFLKDELTNFSLELTWMRDWEKPYNLGDNETHLCLRTKSDYSKIREYHRGLGVICHENHAMGIYFISDPDGYWIEILPERK